MRPGGLAHPVALHEVDVQREEELECVPGDGRGAHGHQPRGVPPEAAADAAEHEAAGKAVAALKPRVAQEADLLVPAKFTMCTGEKNINNGATRGKKIPSSTHPSIFLYYQFNNRRRSNKTSSSSSSTTATATETSSTSTTVATATATSSTSTTVATATATATATTTVTTTI